ncbi:MAG: helix-turn-helix domain-containing protein [Ginsengibacter sp.]
METVFLSLTKNDFQDLIAETVNSCLRRNANQTPTPQPDNYITRQQAADMLHITLPTLLNWTLDGKIKGYRIGRRVLYKKHEINEAVTSINVKRKGGKGQ